MNIDCRYGVFEIISTEDLISKSLIEYGEWAQIEIDTITKFINPGDVVIDAGAYIGTHTIAFSKIVGDNGKVFAFEPNPKVFKILKNNCIQNKCNNVVLYQFALGNTNGQVRLFTTSDNNFGANSLLNLISDNKNYEIVEQRKLDSVLNCSIQFIKADLEGMEFEFLKGGENLIKKYKPGIFLEVNNLQYSTPIIEWAKKSGYLIYGIITPAYNEKNYKLSTKNIFGIAKECGILLLHADMLYKYENSLNVLDLPEIETIDDLALLLLHKPQYYYEVLNKSKVALKLGTDYQAHKVIFLENELKYRNDEIKTLNSILENIKIERDTLRVKVFSKSSKPVIILDHSFGGGANEYTNRLIEDKPLAIVIRYNFHDKYFFAEFHGYKIEKFSYRIKDFKEIGQMVRYFNVEEIIINELVSYPKVLEIVDFLVELKKIYNNIKINFMGHDFFCICPMYCLLDYKIEYCNVPSDISYCNKCIKLNPLMKVYASYIQQDYPDLNISLWREKFGNLLESSSQITCFSQNSKEIIQKAYPSLSDTKFKINPHIVDWVRPVIINKTSNTINIAVLGNMAIHKGVSIVCNMADYIYRTGYNILIHHFGLEYIYDDNISRNFKSNPIIVKHGQYKKENLPELMEKYEIDCIFIPSIWPETFSFTVEEAIKMNLPVAVFDLGAPAERVKNYPKGIILKNKDPEYILNKILEVVNKNIS